MLNVLARVLVAFTHTELAKVLVLYALDKIAAHSKSKMDDEVLALIKAYLKNPR